MKISGQLLHMHAISPPQKRNMVATKQEAGWATEQVWTFLLQARMQPQII